MKNHENDAIATGLRRTPDPAPNAPGDALAPETPSADLLAQDPKPLIRDHVVAPYTNPSPAPKS